MTAAAAAWWLMGTSIGSAWLVRRLLDRWSPAASVQVDQMTGSLFGGLAAGGIRLRGVPRLPPESAASIGTAVIVPFMSFLRYGPNAELYDVLVEATPAAERITAERVEWSLGMMTATGVLAEGLTRVAGDSSLEVQRLDMAWPPGLEQIRTVDNARLRLQYSDPLVFFASQCDGRINAHIASSAVDVREVLDLALPRRFFPLVRGSIGQIDLTLEGTRREARVTGGFHVGRLSRGEFTLTESPGVMDVTITTPDGAPATVAGRITLAGGQIVAREAVIRLEPSTIDYPGQGAPAVYNLSGTSQVADTSIRIRLTGTRYQPNLVLTSDPVRSQQALLLMLATGKTWRGAQETLGEGTISSDLATDFIDYFVFGGLGTRLGRRIGVTDLAITQDQETKQIGLETTFRDRVSVGVQVDPETLTGSGGTGTTQPGAGTLPYKVGAEYRVTPNTSLQVENERSVIAPDRGGNGGALTGPSTAVPRTDDTTLFKVKRRF